MAQKVASSSQKTGLIQQAAQVGIRSADSHTQAVRPIDRLKSILNAQSVQEQFKNVLAENSGAFVASIIDLWNNDRCLQMCDPKAVVMEALKAASLKLPINKQLGFAWIVAYKDGKTGQYIPTFQLGYKGYIQLCLRTGAYKYINADAVYEGELVRVDKLTGEIELDPSKRTSDKIIGYFAYLETVNGFRKALYMTKEEIIKHAERYSKSYGNQHSPWATDFDAMALKTCLRLLLGKYGIMSTEMQQAYIADSKDTEIPGQEDAAIEADFTVHPNAEPAEHEAVTPEPTLTDIASEAGK